MYLPLVQQEDLSNYSEPQIEEYESPALLNKYSRFHPSTKI